jgi:hypothetical protein
MVEEGHASEPEEVVAQSRFNVDMFDARRTSETTLPTASTPPTPTATHAPTGVVLAGLGGGALGEGCAGGDEALAGWRVTVIETRPPADRVTAVSKGTHPGAVARIVWCPGSTGREMSPEPRSIAVSSTRTSVLGRTSAGTTTERRATVGSS